MQTVELQRRFDLSLTEVEALREKLSGQFGVTQFRQASRWSSILEELGQMEALRLGREQMGETEFMDNLVTNQGIAHILSIGLDAGTQITTWYLTMSSTDTTAAVTMTAATPVFTEITTSNVTESIRQTWTGGSVTGTTTASIDNSASIATYTCDTAGFTAYAAALIGGGTSAFGNTTGTLYSYSKFASSKVLTSTDTIDVTYTFTSTDA